MAPSFGCRHALLLQGPNGPFFRRFADELNAAQVAVTKVNFHAGDWAYFHDARALNYRGKPRDFGAYLEKLIAERQIDAVFVFGDGRPHHRVSAEVCARLGVRYFVFEEGYLRPDWVTLEEYGVNGYSRMPRDPGVFHDFARAHTAPRGVEHVGATFGVGAFYATWLAICASFGRPWFLHYHHHRSIFWIAEMCRWLRGAFRKYLYRFCERGVMQHITTALHKRYYFVALQVHCDYQIEHSSYRDVETFISDIMASFAEHAPRDVSLVIKHHPMDRAYKEYGALIRRRERELGLTGRVLYVHDLHLPTLLRSALGSVMINSTVGLQSAQYGTPVKVMGDAVYDMPGLTYQGELKDFWRAPGGVDEALYQAFRTYLLCMNQANGSFARRLPGKPSGAGLRWFPGEVASRSEDSSIPVRVKLG